MTEFQPASSALVLIDLQNDILNGPDGRLTDWARPIVAATSRVVDACRAAGLPVYWVKVERRSDLSDVGDATPQLVLDGKMPHPKTAKRLVTGTPGAEIVNELQPRPDEDVVVKRRVSALHGTQLDVLLRARRIETILIGGVATEVGVESTVRSAWDHDYQVIVLADCCASANTTGHQHALDMSLRRFAQIASSDEVVKRLRAMGR